MPTFFKQKPRPFPCVPGSAGARSFGLGRRVALAALLGLAITTPALAQEDKLGKAVPWEIDTSDPESSVPSQDEANKDPMGYGYFLMSLADGAEAAEAKEDWAGARRFYAAIAKGAPDRAVGLEKVCELDLKLGDYEEALDHCYQMLSRKGVEMRSFLVYVKAVTQAPRELGDANKDKALNAMDHFQKAHPEAAMRGRCLLGMHFADQALLELCVPKVLEAEKDAPSEQGLSFAWRLAMMHEDFDAAQRYVDQLKPISTEETLVVAMEQAVQDAKAGESGKRSSWIRRGLLAAVILGLYFWWRRRQEDEAGAKSSES